MVERVEVSPTPQEDPNPAFREPQQPAQEPQAPAQETPPQAPQRPHWLPQGLNTPEEAGSEVVRLRAELAALKQGQSQPAGEGDGGDPPKPQERQILNQETMSRFEQEYLTNGGLSPESYQALESQYGVSRDMVDGHIASRVAAAQAAEEKLLADYGGAEAVNAMMEWAASNWQDAESRAFNAAMASGDVGQMRLALSTLKGSHAAASAASAVPGSGLLRGETGADTSGVQPFQNMHQAMEAMRDPRYHKDPAYVQEVENRMRVSAQKGLL